MNELIGVCTFGPAVAKTGRLNFESGIWDLGSAHKLGQLTMRTNPSTTR